MLRLFNRQGEFSIISTFVKSQRSSSYSSTRNISDLPSNATRAYVIFNWFNSTTGQDTQRALDLYELTGLGFSVVVVSPTPPNSITALAYLLMMTMDTEERRYIIYHIDHVPRRITRRVHSHRQYDKMDAIRFL